MGHNHGEPATKVFVDLIESYMNKTIPKNRGKMNQAYKTAMELEYMFWDGIYKKIKWIN